MFYASFTSFRLPETTFEAGEEDERNRRRIEISG
jgi:hypothetical protein